MEFTNVLKQKQINQRDMTAKEKQIYDEVVITPDELKAEAIKYVLKGRNVYSPVIRDVKSARIYGQPNADGTGMALAGCLKIGESLEKWVERKIRMREVIEYRVKNSIIESRRRR